MVSACTKELIQVSRTDLTWIQNLKYFCPADNPPMQEKSTGIALTPLKYFLVSRQSK